MVSDLHFLFSCCYTIYQRKGIFPLFHFNSSHHFRTFDMFAQFLSFLNQIISSFETLLKVLFVHCHYLSLITLIYDVQIQDLILQDP